MSKIKKIPNLRFKEFNNNWDKKILSDVLYENNKYSNRLGSRITVKLGLKGIVKRKVRASEKIGFTNQFIRNAGDFIYGKQNIEKGCFGIIPKNLDECVSSADIPSFKFKKGFLNFFLYYKFSNNKFYESLKFKMEGSSSKRLHVNTFLNLPIYFPTYKEQEKVVNFFHKFEEVISLYKKKLLLLSQIKKYYLSIIFPKDNNIPEFRFKEFDKGWTQNFLGNISKIDTGNKNTEHKNDNGLYPFYVCSSKIEKINSYSYDGEAILMAGSGSISRIIHYINGKFDYQQRVYKISDSSENLKFIFYYLQTDIIKKYLLSLSQDSVINNLKLPIIKKCKLNIPCKKEQQKIVNFFSKIDTNINHFEQKIKILKNIKNYYLQNMFI